MQKLLYRLGTPVLGAGCLVMLALIVVNRNAPEALLSLFSAANLQSFHILFVSILLEAFPFIMIGVIFSALLQVFVSDETIRRFTPRHPILGIVFGGLLGIIFPLCECGMIPVIRRLIRKGMPAYIGIVYLLAGPIVNPIVFSSTYLAFRSTPELAYARMALGLAVATVIGFLLVKFLKASPLIGVHNEGSLHREGRLPVIKRGRLNKWSSTLAHASDEFFDMGKYLIIGALLTAVIQTVVDRGTIAAFAEQPLLSYLFMMVFAFILSICSTSDAFIASSFGGIFTSGPLLAFLVFGPMIDLKNMLMMLSTFKVKIVLILIALAFTLTLAGAALAEVLL
ncbi:permease [Paenibacillus nanensis]|uniref:Permease n=1 Tax=Paenibacillus nanensis TaxID=393251 RepID=A0A3A1V030_9BACL|nr:permease [Paenibacillus nanensis]RIX53061.1 permease [Paenibacillus nanensis]